MDLQGLDAIIFDFDGVLVESVDVKTRAFATLYEAYGKPVVAQIEDYHLRNGGISRFDKFRYFQTEILGGKALDERAVSTLAEAFSTLVIDKVVAAPMVQGAQEFLDEARKQLRLFVVSGTPTSELDEIIRRRKLGKYFAGIWGSPASKTENIAQLLKQHDLAAGHCVMIGDAMADYTGASSNAVSFLGRVAENDANPFARDIRTFSDFCHLPASWN